VRCFAVAVTLALAGALPSPAQEAKPPAASSLAEEKTAEAAVQARPAKWEPRWSLLAWIAYGQRSDVWDYSADLGIGAGVSVRLGPSQSRFRGLGAITLYIPNKPASYTLCGPLESDYCSIDYNSREARSLSWTFEHYGRIRGTLHGVYILTPDTRFRVYVGAGVAFTRSSVRGATRVVWASGQTQLEPYSGADSYAAPELLYGVETGRGRLKPFLQMSALTKAHEGTLRAGVRF
jgi:hypothetical protein